jgi:mannose-1-phosphate guanylyltransferase
MESIAIDYGIFERAEKVLVIPADLGWSDVGSWASLHDVLCGDTQQDVVVRGRHLGRGDRHCLIYGQNKLIATVGLENVIVVETADVILVCSKDRAQEVGDLVKRLKEEGLEQYL